MRNIIQRCRLIWQDSAPRLPCRASKQYSLFTVVCKSTPVTAIRAKTIRTTWLTKESLLWNCRAFSLACSTVQWVKKCGNLKRNKFLYSIESFLYCLSCSLNPFDRESEICWEISRPFINVLNLTGPFTEKNYNFQSLTKVQIWSFLVVYSHRALKATKRRKSG